MRSHSRNLQAGRHNVSAVNYHFRDKSELYLAAVLHAHRCGASADDDDGSSLGPPPEQLRCFIYHFLTRVLAVDAPDDWRQQLMLREMLNPTRAFDVLLAEMIRPRFVRLQTILRELCPGVDERKLNALSFSVIGQCFHYRVAGSFIEGLIGKDARASLTRDYLTDHITSFCLRGRSLAHQASNSEEAESMVVR